MLFLPLGLALSYHAIFPPSLYNSGLAGMVHSHPAATAAAFVQHPHTHTHTHTVSTDPHRHRRQAHSP